MTVIAASSGTYRSRVDGTIVLSVEIEPQYREAALKLFGMPGTSMALAALKDGHAAKSDKPEAEKQGELCKWAVMRCKEPEFREWLGLRVCQILEHESQAAAHIKRICGVTSRRYLDLDPEAGEIFKEKVMKPFAARGCRE